MLSSRGLARHGNCGPAASPRRTVLLARFSRPEPVVPTGSPLGLVIPALHPTFSQHQSPIPVQHRRLRTRPCVVAWRRRPPRLCLQQRSDETAFGAPHDSTAPQVAVMSSAVSGSPIRQTLPGQRPSSHPNLRLYLQRFGRAPRGSRLGLKGTRHRQLEILARARAKRRCSRNERIASAR